MGVIKGDVNHMVSMADQDKMRENPKTAERIRMLLEDPFNIMSIITPNLGLTGLGGLNCENLLVFKFPVKTIFNVTYEAPKFKVDNIESFRIPVGFLHGQDLSLPSIIVSGRRR